MGAVRAQQRTQDPTTHHPLHHLRCEHAQHGKGEVQEKRLRGLQVLQGVGQDPGEEEDPREVRGHASLRQQDRRHRRYVAMSDQHSIWYYAE